MSKFDPSIGLSAREIDVIKYNIKKGISSELPQLPDAVETQLFLCGRAPWTFSWKLLNSKPTIDLNRGIAVEVTAKLKREFHRYGVINRYTFLCNVKATENLYHPTLTITKIP